MEFNTNVILKLGFDLRCTCPKCGHMKFANPHLDPTAITVADGKMSYAVHMQCDNCHSSWTETQSFSHENKQHQEDVRLSKTYNHDDLKINSKTPGIAKARELIKGLNQLLEDNQLKLIFDGESNKMLIVKKYAEVSYKNLTEADEEYLDDSRGEYEYATKLVVADVLDNRDAFLAAVPMAERNK